jgi:hypothetical protein
MSRLRYRTALYDTSFEAAPKEFRTRAFCLCLRPIVLSSEEYDSHLDDADDSEIRTPVILHRTREKLVLAPELIIEADTPKHAERAANLVTAAAAVFFGQEMFDEINFDPDHPRIGSGRYIQADGFGHVAEIAVRAHRRKFTEYALIRLASSFRVLGMHLIDLHPNYGREFLVTDDPFMFVRFAQAIASAAGAMEELGVKVPASEKRPAKILGAWNPEVLADLQKKLVKIGVPPDYKVSWHVRGGRSRIKRKNPPPSGDPESWTTRNCRDRTIPIADGVQYAEWLRSKTSVHCFCPLTESLTVYDATNVQFLSRALFYKAIGFHLPEWG